MQEFTAKAADEGLRADVFVASKYPQFSRSSLERLFDEGLVKNNLQAAKPASKIRTGDKIIVDETLLRQEPPKIDLPIIYEDEDVIVINKPAGILTHSKGALNLEPSVASFIRSKITDRSLAGNRAGVVHRLDRATSGVIITAKTAAALTWLQKQFSTRKTKKIYLAVVEGVPSPAAALIDASIARNPRRPQTFQVNSAGKPAQTRYKILKTIQKDGQRFSVLELSPLTGRTHQLRVHLAYLKHPIVGDGIYGKKGPQLLLHAAELDLSLPSRQQKTFRAEPPVYFEEFIR